MTGLWDAERDAREAAQALAGLVALLRREAAERGGDDTQQLLLSIAEDGTAAAERVVAYLRQRRGAGDGEVTAVPPRLAPWRDWVPTRGHLFERPDAVHRAKEVPQPRRSDPGE